MEVRADEVSVSIKVGIPSTLSKDGGAAPYATGPARKYANRVLPGDCLCEKKSW
jgi:hypothetical protein